MNSTFSQSKFIFELQKCLRQKSKLSLNLRYNVYEIYAWYDFASYAKSRSPGNFSTNLIVNLSKTGLLRAYFAQLVRSENNSINPLVPRALHEFRPSTATISKYTNGRNKRSSRGVKGTTLLSNKGESSDLFNFSSFPDIFANSNTASRTY